MINYKKSKVLETIKNKNVENDEDVDSIIKKLKEACEFYKIKCITAPQLGINKKIAYLNIKSEIILINPVIKNKSKEKVVYLENCLGVMHKPIKTLRSINVSVECSNFVNELYFKNDNPINQDDKYLSDEGLFECVCVQQCVDLLNNILITHKDVKFMQQKYLTKNIKYQRNDKVILENSDKSERISIKYKKCKEYLDNGWKII
jgi:peptide deformylase